MSDLKYGFQRHEGEGKSKRYVWTLVGDRGAVHAWAEFTTPAHQAIIREKTFGGIECHFPAPPYDHSEETPLIENCWLTGKPCWPDGSSLAYDNIRQIVEMAGDNPESISDFINAELLSWYQANFDKGAS